MMPTLRIVSTGVIGALLGIALGMAPPAAPAAKPAAPAAKPAAATVTPLAHVEERGTGAIPMILVPGLSCDWRVYDAFMTRNTDKYKMYAVTLPGFGGSAPPPLPEGTSPMDGAWLANAEAAILKLIEDRKLNKPVLVGHSIGGHLAIRMAAAHGDKFSKVISIDGLPLYPPPRPDQPDTRESREQMVAQMGAMIKQIPAERWTDLQKSSVAGLVTDQNRAKELGEMCAVVPQATTLEYVMEMMGSDQRSKVASIKVPLLTISAMSSEAPQEMIANARQMVRDEFKDAPSNVTLITFLGTRHFVMDDRPADLDRAVATFLAGGTVTDLPAPTAPPAPQQPVAPKQAPESPTAAPSGTP
jgi:pimeloyl-ACP methyl ester carboxylesterase